MTNPDPVGMNGQGADGRRFCDRRQRGTVASEKARERSPVLHHRQLREPARQAVLLGGLGGELLREAVQEPVAETVQPELQSVASEENPPPLGFPASRRTGRSYADLPAHGKPDTQQVIRSFQEAVWGGAPDDATVTTLFGAAVAGRPNDLRRGRSRRTATGSAGSTCTRSCSRWSIRRSAT